MFLFCFLFCLRFPSGFLLTVDVVPPPTGFCGIPFMEPPILMNRGIRCKFHGWHLSSTTRGPGPASGGGAGRPAGRRHPWRATGLPVRAAVRRVQRRLQPQEGAGAAEEHLPRDCPTPLDSPSNRVCPTNGCEHPRFSFCRAWKIRSFGFCAILLRVRTKSSPLPSHHTPHFLSALLIPILPKVKITKRIQIED